jgi:hypothetical protein
VLRRDLTQTLVYICRTYDEQVAHCLSFPIYEKAITFTVDLGSYMIREFVKKYIKLLDEGFLLVKLKSTLWQFYGRHHDMVDRYGVSVSQITTDMFHFSTLPATFPVAFKGSCSSLISVHLFYILLHFLCWICTTYLSMDVKQLTMYHTYIYCTSHFRARYLVLIYYNFNTIYILSFSTIDKYVVHIQHKKCNNI